VRYARKSGEQHVVTITNNSQQPVLDLEVVSLGDPRPEIEWGSLFGSTGHCDVLPPNEQHHVRFEHFLHGYPVNFDADDPDPPIQKWVDASNVTITFSDVDGQCGNVPGRANQFG
jgi:hypothetical protein